MLRPVTITEYDIGDTVVCDLCNEDFTSSTETGGFLFSSKGVCPHCAPKFEESARKYREEKYIRNRARKGETFKDFILRIRGGNNTVRITSY
jgi:hypothetical protein